MELAVSQVIRAMPLLSLGTSRRPEDRSVITVT